MAIVGEVTTVFKGDAASLEKAAMRAEQAVGRMGKTAKMAQGPLDNLQQSLFKIGGTATQAGVALTAGITVPLTAVGTVAAKSFAEFERSLNRVQAVSGATASEMKALTDQAAELGRTTQYTASQAAEAQGFLAMAGMKATEMLGAMPSVLQLAASAQMDLARAADITTNVMTGYGQSVQDLGHVNDVLVKAFTSANTDLEQLGQAFKYAGPVAKAAGVSFEESAAALAVMGNAGIQASMAGTSLRGAISHLLNPTKEAATLLREMGVTATDAQGRLLPLDEIIRQLEPHANDAGAMMTIFGQRAGPAMAALVGQGAKSLTDLTEKLQNSGGVAQRIADVQMQGLYGSWLKLKSASEGLAISLGNALAPTLEKVAVALAAVAQVVQTTLVPLFTSLPEPVKMLAVAFAAMAAAAGPVLVMVGMMASGLGGLLAIFAAIPAGAVAAFSAMTAPLIAAAAGVAAFIAQWVLLPAAVGAATYAVAKWAVEATGLDKALGSLINRMRGFNQAEAERSDLIDKSTGLVKGAAEAEARQAAMRQKVVEVTKKQAAALTEEQKALQDVIKSARDYESAASRIGRAFEISQGLSGRTGRSRMADISAAIGMTTGPMFGPAAKDLADEIKGAMQDGLLLGMQSAGPDIQRQFTTLVSFAMSQSAKNLGSLSPVDLPVHLKVPQSNIGPLIPTTAQAPKSYMDIYGEVYGNVKVKNISDKTESVAQSTFDWSRALGSVADMYQIIGGNANSTFGQLLTYLGQVLSATQGLRNATTGQRVQGAIAAAPGVFGAMQQGPLQGAIAGGAAGGQLAGPWGAAFGALAGGLGGLLGSAGRDRAQKAAEEEALKAQMEQLKSDAMAAFEDMRSQAEQVWSGIMSDAVTGLGAVFTWMGEQEDITAERLDAMGVVGVGVFQSLRRHGMTVVDAVNMMGPALESALKSAQENGLELTGTFAELTHYFDLIGQNESLVNAVEGMSDVLGALASTGNLTQETFSNVMSEMQNMYAQLIEQGFTADQALALMAPYLLEAQQAAQRYGLQLDDVTQQQIAAAEAGGYFEGLTTDQEKMVEVLQVMLQVLDAIGVAFGVELPAAVEEYVNSLAQIPRLPGETPTAPTSGGTSGTTSGGGGYTFPGESQGGYVPPGVPGGGGQGGFYSPSMPYGPGPHGESYLPVHPGEDVRASPAGAGPSISINAPVTVNVPEGGGDPQAIADAIVTALNNNLSGALTAAIRDAAAT